MQAIVSLTEEFQTLKTSSSEDIEISVVKAPKYSKFDVNKFKGTSSSASSQKGTPKKSSSSNFDSNKFARKPSSLSANQKPDALFTYNAGTYDVMLFVDNCEQTA